MAEEHSISIGELEKAIHAVQRGETPDVNLPPEVVRAIAAAMNQLGDFSPTPEFLERLQRSLEGRLKEKNKKVTITIPLAHVRNASMVLCSLVFVIGVWVTFGDQLLLSHNDEKPAPPSSVPVTTNDTLNLPQSVALISPQPTAKESLGTLNSLVEDAKEIAIPAKTDTAPPEKTVPILEKETLISVIKITPEIYGQLRDELVPVRVIPYLPDFYWLELQPSEIAKIPSSSNFEEIKTPFELFQKEGYEDPLIGLPQVKKELSAEMTPKLSMLFLLQLIGETKQEWLDALLQKGAVFVGPATDYKRILVWGTPELVDSLAQLDFVRWVGPLHPQYKIQEKLLTTEVPAFAINVIIYAKNKEMLDEVKVALLDLGAIIMSKNEVIAENKTTIQCAVSPQLVPLVARIANVISISAEKSREAQYKENLQKK